MTKRTFFLLAFGSLILFSLLAWVITAFFGPAPLPEIIQSGAPLPIQLTFGLVLGVIIGLLAWALISLPFFVATKEFFIDIIGPWRLNWLEILLISCCAGIGEELLFRGAIQPHLGIIWTSVLFVVLHGYITPFNGPLSVYGLFMILAISLLGWVCATYGLYLVIVAHTVIDIILLYALTRAYSPGQEKLPVE